MCMEAVLGHNLCDTAFMSIGSETEILLYLLHFFPIFFQTEVTVYDCVVLNK